MADGQDLRDATLKKADVSEKAEKVLGMLLSEGRGVTGPLERWKRAGSSDPCARLGPHSLSAHGLAALLTNSSPFFFRGQGSIGVICSHNSI